MKYKISNLKIALYILRKDYDNGIKYIESFENNEFQKPYQKAMYLNNFKALICEEKGDASCSKAYYENVTILINEYLKTNKDDFSALTDYYFIKLRFENKKLLLTELDSLKNNQLYDADLLDALYETINEDYNQQ